MATSRREPIGHTCPDIDHVIKTLMGVKREIDTYMSLAHKSDDDNVLIDRTTLYSWSDDIADIADGRLCSLENLRDANSTLRSWGNDLVSDLEDKDREIDQINDDFNKETKHLEEKIDGYVDEIYDLSGQVKELERELQLMENR